MASLGNRLTVLFETLGNDRRVESQRVLDIRAIGSGSSIGGTSTGGSSGVGSGSSGIGSTGTSSSSRVGSSLGSSASGSSYSNLVTKPISQNILETIECNLRLRQHRQRHRQQRPFRLFRRLFRRPCPYLPMTTVSKNEYTFNALGTYEFKAIPTNETTFGESESGSLRSKEGQDNEKSGCRELHFQMDDE